MADGGNAGGAEWVDFVWANDGVAVHGNTKSLAALQSLRVKQIPMQSATT